MLPPLEPIGPEIPTEGNAMAAYLLNFYRHSAIAARKAAEAQKEIDELPAEK